jgi:hypothetical protein
MSGSVRTLTTLRQPLRSKSSSRSDHSFIRSGPTIVASRSRLRFVHALWISLNSVAVSRFTASAAR